MTIKISYSKKTIKNSSNLILFSNDKFEHYSPQKKNSNLEFSYINDLLKSSDLKKKFLVLKLIQKKL